MKNCKFTNDFLNVHSPNLSLSLSFEKEHGVQALAQWYLVSKNSKLYSKIER
jgi:hypothetical protein